MKVHIPLENAFRREEVIKAEAGEEIRTIERQEESKNLSLRRDITILKTQLDAKSRQLTQMTTDQTVLKIQHTELNAHYTKLYEEAKHLIYTVERKEHDLNFLKAKMNAEEAGIYNINLDHSGTISLVFGKLKQELKDSHLETDRLQQLWVRSQKESLKAKDQITELQEENSLLHTRLGISDAVKLKTESGLAEVKNDANEQKWESAKLYNQIKRMQPIITDLKLTNVKVYLI